MLKGQHLFSISLLDQAPPDKGAQDAPVQISLRFNHDSLINATGRVKTKFQRTKNHPRRCGLVTCISTYFAWHRLKHPINHANMEMHMLIQA